MEARLSACHTKALKACERGSLVKDIVYVGAGVGQVEIVTQLVCNHLWHQILR